MLVLIYTTQSIDRLTCCGKPVKNRCILPVVNNKFRLLAKAKNWNYISGVFAASSEGGKGRRQTGKFMPDREISHVCHQLHDKVALW